MATLKERSVFFPSDKFDGRNKNLTKQHWQTFEDFCDQQKLYITDRGPDATAANIDQIIPFFKMTLTDLARAWLERQTFTSAKDLKEKFLTDFSPYGKTHRQWIAKWAELKFNQDIDNIDEFLEKFEDLAQLNNLRDDYKIHAFKIAMPKEIELHLRGIDNLQNCYQTAKDLLTIVQNPVEPFNPYTQANYDPPGKEYSLDADGHFIIYDIDEEETPYSSNRTTFVRTESDESKLWLAQPANKVKKTWYNQIVKTELNVDPKFATDNACYEMESILPNIASNVIQATYLGPMKDIPSKPTFHITPGSLVQAQLPSGLKVTVLIDTGCHKTILNRKFLQKNLFHFKNFKKVPLREDHKIKLANGLIIKTDGLIAMPLIIQDYLFQFLALVTALSGDFDFVLGLESLIQLESVYSLGQNILQMENRCIPLYPVKDVILPPKAQIGIVITGELPRTFSSGFAVVHVIPVTNTYSVVTTEIELINQTTCFNLTNTINKSRYFYHNIPFGYLDTRSIGYYEPLTATQMISSDHLIFPSHMASISEHSIDRLIHEEPALDNQDPYPWLDPQDPRRFQTDREL